MKYKYIARYSDHQGHTVMAIEWGKGKCLFYCCECELEFYGLRRCIRKIKEER